MHYCLAGDGDVPLRSILEVLSDAGYDGWITFEWERKWHPELPPPEVAFPHFIKHMKKLVGKMNK